MHTRERGLTQIDIEAKKQIIYSHIDIQAQSHSQPDNQNHRYTLKKAQAIFTVLPDNVTVHLRHSTDPQSVKILKPANPEIDFNFQRGRVFIQDLDGSHKRTIGLISLLELTGIVPDRNTMAPDIDILNSYLQTNQTNPVSSTNLCL